MSAFARASGWPSSANFTTAVVIAFVQAGHQYGYSAAISILIFFIVASVSYLGFRRTKALEEIN